MDDEGLIDKLSRSFELEMPDGRSMDDYLDEILPLIRPWSEDLYEEAFFLDTRWLEMRDDEHFNETILHIFRAKSEYMIVREGDIDSARWNTLPNSNTLLLEGKRKEFFDLAFLNQDFLVLRKHGDQQKKGMRKYFVLGREAVVSRLEWRDMMELMFNLYRGNSKLAVYLAVFAVIIAAIIIFSIL